LNKGPYATQLSDDVTETEIEDIRWILLSSPVGNPGILEV
jgi:hypothetical protein